MFSYLALFFLAADKIGEDTPYEVSFVDGMFRYVARRIASQTSKSCDERSIDRPPTPSPCKVRVIKGEMIGEPCLL